MTHLTGGARRAQYEKTVGNPVGPVCPVDPVYHER